MTCVIWNLALVYLETELVVSAIKPIVGFGVDDHRIRELMRFAEMTSREYSKEVVEDHGGSSNSIGRFS